jgi:hypothetical protein
MRAETLPAFFEGKYKVETQSALGPQNEAALTMSMVMLPLLERTRG